MTPRISIGVPVYNGASLLAETLDDLRAQTLADFEVMISDNASTDDTAEIAERYCAMDGRFRLIRQAENLGPLPNYLAVAEAARCDRFLWRAYDDLSNREFLAELNAAMDAAPDAWLVAPRSGTVRIGSARKRMHPVAGLRPGMAPAALLARSRAGWFYGMMRRDYAVETIRVVIAEYPHLWAWDHLMMFPAILAGRVAFADDAVFFHRLNAYAEKAARPMTTADCRKIAGDFRAFCARRIGTAGLGSLDRARMTLALERHIGRRVMPLRRRFGI